MPSRREDIIPLARRFLAHACEANGAALMAIEPEALALLENYSWPGNVRELRNVIERAVVIAEAPILTVQDLPERLRTGRLASPAVPAASASALRETHGNVADAARRLGLPLRTMQQKMKARGIRRLGFGHNDPESSP